MSCVLCVPGRWQGVQYSLTLPISYHGSLSSYFSRAGTLILEWGDFMLLTPSLLLLLSLLLLFPWSQSCSCSWFVMANISNSPCTVSTVSYSAACNEWEKFNPDIIWIIVSAFFVELYRSIYVGIQGLKDVEGVRFCHKLPGVQIVWLVETHKRPAEWGFSGNWDFKTRRHILCLSLHWSNCLLPLSGGFL